MSRSRSRKPRGFKRILIGFILGIIAAIAVFYLWLLITA